MKRLLVLLLLVSAAPAFAQTAPGFDPDTVRAGRLDGGKMWLFEAPPVEYLAQTYNFRPDAAWFERARLATLRLPGCSASFVSATGLVATNHHCAEGYVVQVTRPGETLLDDGFYARSRAEERPVEELYVDQLVAIDDVTAEVTTALAAAAEAGRPAALRAATAAIQARLGAVRGEGHVVEVVGLYAGGRYSAYTFRRYDDVRLVMAPEIRLGFFGGDYDNFTYPRYALDFAFLRVYGADGQPLRSEHFFPLSTEGVDEGDLIFVVGNPGSTSRGLTTDQLALARDVLLPTSLRALDSRLDALRAHLRTNPPDADAVRSQIFGLSNSEKASLGRVRALRDPYLMARRAAAQRDFLAASPGSRALVDEMAGLVAERQALADGVRAFSTLNNAGLSAPLLRRAFALRSMEAAHAAGNAEGTARAETAFRGVEDLAPLVAEAYLTAQIEDLRAYYAVPGRTLPAPLQGASAADVARRLLSTSALATADHAAAAFEARTLQTDPAVALVEAIGADVAAYESATAALSTRQQDLARRLGRARYDAFGPSVPPDATFSPRFTDGVVRGYAYNGTMAPPHTTLFGLFDRHFSHGAEPGGDWTLPQRWIDARGRLDLSTPLDFASTSDTIGGNSGSPAVNRDLELVGLNFDRTIEGLSRDYLYLPDRGRNVMVDARAILHALDVVYEMDYLIDEMTGD